MEKNENKNNNVNNVNDDKRAAAMAAVERANREAGYDIAVAKATLNALVINEQRKAAMPPHASRVDLMAAVDVMLRANGNKIDGNVMGSLIEFGIVYGYHYAKTGESLLLDDGAMDELTAFVDGRDDMTDIAKAQRREGLTKGAEALAKAVNKAEREVKLYREMGRK